MRSTKILVMALSVASMLCSTGCRQTVQSGRMTIPMVESIISDHTAAFDLLESFDVRDSRGSVAIIGPEDRNERFAKLLLKGDDFDNIDGRLSPDQLPDFAGEQIDIVDDKANAPYSIMSVFEPQQLREVNVLNFLASMDSTFSLGAFDEEKLSHKLPSKMQVFTSPYAAAYGAFDIDTLCRAAGCDVPVVYPSRLVFGAQLDRNIAHMHVVVVTDSLTAADGVYPAVFDDMTRERVIYGDGCVAVAVRDSVVTMQKVIDAYRASGGQMPISAVIIDDPAVSPQTIESSIQYIFSVQNEANLSYRKLLAPDLQTVEMDLFTARECYWILRKRNIFTHNITYPYAERYMTVRSSSGEGFKLVESD